MKDIYGQKYHYHKKNHVYLNNNNMGKIIKENGKIYFEEITESYGVKHIRRTHIGDYEEIEENPKPKRVYKKKKETD